MLLKHLSRGSLKAALRPSLSVPVPQSCGFATLGDVETPALEDRMESFFLSETLKYLYLLFDPESRFAQNYVFTTEGYADAYC